VGEKSNPDDWISSTDGRDFPLERFLDRVVGFFRISPIKKRDEDIFVGLSWYVDWRW
jgi:hypothetical protein